MRLAALLLFALCLPAVSAGAQDGTGAAALEGRLVAPCCWSQTLDIHDSPLASELRGEIRARLARGEAASVIEDELAGRYGERIRAVPRGEDPRSTLTLWVTLALLAAGLAVTAVGWRWSMARAQPVPHRSTAPTVDDARLDAELAAFSDD